MPLTLIAGAKGTYCSLMPRTHNPNLASAHDCLHNYLLFFDITQLSPSATLNNLGLSLTQLETSHLFSC